MRITQKNTGRNDRIIRIILAILITSIGIYFKSWWALVAILPLATGLLGFCFIYRLFGIDTCKKRPPRSKYIA